MEFINECIKEYKEKWATKKGFMERLRCGIGDTIYAIILLCLFASIIVGFVLAVVISVSQQFGMTYAIAFGHEHLFSLFLLSCFFAAGWALGGKFFNRK
jgi:hypothetical protein